MSLYSDYKWKDSSIWDQCDKEIDDLKKGYITLGVTSIIIGIILAGIGFLILINTSEMPTFLLFPIILCIIGWWVFINAGGINVGSLDRQHWLIKPKMKIILDKYEQLDRDKVDEKKAKDAGSREKRKKELVEKYGEKDGMLIFNKKISEKRYLNKIAKEKEKEKRERELIEKYGEKDGLAIFNKKISEKNYLKKKDLTEKYGDKFGKAVFDGTILENMSTEMVIDAIGNPNFKDGEKWYHGNPFNRCIIFQADKVNESNTLSEGLWLDMPKDMLISSYGNPEDEKKEVSKSGTKLKWYYGGRTTRQRTTAYSLEVRLENDLVVGWRELE